MASEFLDGTQAPPPGRLYPDPLAGLVTGSTADVDILGDRFDVDLVPVIKPVHVDRDAALAMLQAVEDSPDDPPPSGAPVKLPAPRGQSSRPSAVPPGMVAIPERVPTKQRVRQVLRAYPKDAGKRQEALADKRRELMAQRFGARQSGAGELAEAAKGGKRGSNSNLTGFIVAIILLVIFGAIAISIISSIVDTVGGMVD